MNLRKKADSILVPFTLEWRFTLQVASFPGHRRNVSPAAWERGYTTRWQYHLHILYKYYEQSL